MSGTARPFLDESAKAIKGMKRKSLTQDAILTLDRLTLLRCLRYQLQPRAAANWLSNYFSSASSRYHDLRGISLVPAFRVRAKPIRRRPMAVANVPW